MAGRRRAGGLFLIHSMHTNINNYQTFYRISRREKSDANVE
jgi:hypothetical protein